VVLLAWAFTAGGEAVLSIIMPKSEDWPLERVLELSSAVLLTLYTVKLFREYFASDDDDGTDENEDAEHDAGKASQDDAQPCEECTVTPAPSSASVTTRPATRRGDCALRPERVEADGAPVLDSELGRTGSHEVDDCESFHTAESRLGTAVHSTDAALEATVPPRPVAPSPALVGLANRDVGDTHTLTSAGGTPAVPASDADVKYTLSKLCTIAIFGSLDDFAVFVSLMLSGLFSAPQLAIGVLIGTTIVVTLCVAVGRFQCVVRVIERIPLFVIIGGFSVWTYVSVFAG